MESFKRARAYAADVFKARPVSCIADVKKLLAAAGPDLVRMDATFSLELGYVDAMLTADMAKAVQLAMLRCLPSVTREVSMQEAEAKLEELASTSRLQCADRSSQSQLDAVREGLSQMRRSLPPSYELWANDGFFKSCLLAFSYFIRIAPGQYGNDSPKELLAREGLNAKLKWVRANLESAEVSYATFDDFFKFTWLLGHSDQKDVKVMVEKVMARTQSSSASAAASSEKKGSKRPKTSGVKKEATAVGCARFF